MQKPASSIIVIFGASGDLTRRKLIPALFDLYRQNFLPENCAVLGVSRSTISDEQFRKRMRDELEKDSGAERKNITVFLKNLFYQSIDTAVVAEYAKLKKRLLEIDRSCHCGGNMLFYLSTPPNLYPVIPAMLEAHGLNRSAENGGWRRLIVEKPFGYDLASAMELNKTLLKYFSEEQIYRIDHYLGKETVQNILALRFSNGIFEPLWNRNYIHHVEITGAEALGVEQRGGYYNRSGAVRDMVQNHLLQIAATIAMEPPAVFGADAVRNEKVKVFQALRSIRTEDVSKQVVRGQYTASTIRGEKVAAYREEKDVPPDSRTETFVALRFYIDNWRWGGVPFFIRSGKRLPTRVTEAVIHFNRTPHSLFADTHSVNEGDNQLIIRIQPDEGILLKFGMKRPGAGFNIEQVGMDFHYSDLGPIDIPEAYERLLLDCLNGDGTLYARADGVEACWKFIDPILNAWRENPDIPLYGYPAGTWGPQEANRLFDNPGEDWRYPCKNLTGDGEYCEL